MAKKVQSAERTDCAEFGCSRQCTAVTGSLQVTHGAYGFKALVISRKHRSQVVSRPKKAAPFMAIIFRCTRQPIFVASDRLTLLIALHPPSASGFQENLDITADAWSTQLEHAPVGAHKCDFIARICHLSSSNRALLQCHQQTVMSPAPVALRCVVNFSDNHETHDSW
jgi:hypothetical protein